MGHNKKRWMSLLQEITSHQVICYYKSKSQRTLSHLQIFTSKSQSLFCKFHEMTALCSFFQALYQGPRMKSLPKVDSGMS